MNNTMPQNPASRQDRDSKSAPRLQSMMAQLGIASRRGAAELIKAGEVLLNGQRMTEPGFRVENPETATITVSGENFVTRRDTPRPRTIMLNKPAGLISSSSDIHGSTVFDCLSNISERLVCVGRLDRNSEGLLLLSNDGELVNRLTHPRYGHVKEYNVVTIGNFDQSVLDFLNSPMKIDGYRIRPVQVDYLERLEDGARGQPRHLLRFILREGRNRQIRNMCEQAGLRIQMLTRLAINSLRLPSNLRTGQWRDLTERDFERLEQIPQG